MDLKPQLLDTLGRRVDRLERETRRLKLGGLLALMVLAAVGVVAQTAVPETIEARRFVVRDANGIMRFEVASRATAFGLDIHDREGRVRASFMVSETTGEPFLQLRDSNGAARVRVDFVFGSPALRVLDADGKDRLELYLKGDGSAVLRIRDVDGKVLWKVP